MMDANRSGPSSENQELMKPRRKIVKLSSDQASGQLESEDASKRISNGSGPFKNQHLAGLRGNNARIFRLQFDDKDNEQYQYIDVWDGYEPSLSIKLADVAWDLESTNRLSNTVISSMYIWLESEIKGMLCILKDRLRRSYLMHIDIIQLKLDFWKTVRHVNLKYNGSATFGMTDSDIAVFYIGLGEMESILKALRLAAGKLHGHCHWILKNALGKCDDKIQISLIRFADFWDVDFAVICKYYSDMVNTSSRVPLNDIKEFIRRVWAHERDAYA